MTAAEYLARIEEELADLAKMTSPPNWQRFTNRRRDLRDRIAKLQTMAGGLRCLVAEPPERPETP